MTTKLKAPSKLTANDWDLYTNTMPCSDAARHLNKALSAALKADTVQEARVIMGKAMREWSDHGAYDSEPRGVAANYLDAKWPGTQSYYEF